MSRALGTILIEKPIGYVGDQVEVENYKMRPPVWEEGTVQDLYFRPGQVRRRHDGSTYKQEPRWTYEVWVERGVTEDRYGRRRGGGYRLTVGADGVRRGGDR